LKPSRQRSITARASEREANASSISHWSRRRPLKLSKAVLLRLAGGDAMPVDARPICPFEHRAAGQLGSFVADDHGRLTPGGHAGVEFSRQTRTAG